MTYLLAMRAPTSFLRTRRHNARVNRMNPDSPFDFTDGPSGQHEAMCPHHIEARLIEGRRDSFGRLFRSRFLQRNRGAGRCNAATSRPRPCAHRTTAPVRG